MKRNPDSASLKPLRTASGHLLRSLRVWTWLSALVLGLLFQPSPAQAQSNVVQGDSQNFTLDTTAVPSSTAPVYGDSSSFTLDTTAVLPNPSAPVYGDSSDFTLDTKTALPNPTAPVIADSSDFTLDTTPNILTVNVTSTGTVGVNPNQTSYIRGTVVTLTATPNAGWVFGGWSGGVTSGSNPLQVTMSGNLNITAMFLPLYSLTVTVNGNGNAAKNPNQTTYVSGSLVTLTAVPSAGWVFTGWSGGVVGLNNPATFAIQGNTTVKATFQTNIVVANLNDTGAGSLRQTVANVATIANPALTFAPGLSGTITLSSGELLITTNVTIIGPSAGVTLSGGGVNRVAHFSGGTNALCNLTIANGNFNGSGGGILNDASSTLTMNNCTVSGNVASGSGYGGGLLNSGTATIRNCTFSGNNAFSGGGIRTDGNLLVLNCTIANNILHTSGFLTRAGGGIYAPAGTATVGGSILDGNTLIDAQGAFTSSGYNLVNNISTGATTTGFTNGINQDLVGVSYDPLLGPLQNNGGPTYTYALQWGSPAIDAGYSFSAVTDQRGFQRTFDYSSVANATGGDGSDIGAFEFSIPPLVISKTSNSAVVSWLSLGATFTLQTNGNWGIRLVGRRAVIPSPPPMARTASPSRPRQLAICFSG